MEKKFIPFSETAKIGNVLYISGQVGMDEVSGELVKSSFASEAERVMQNIVKDLPLKANIEISAIARLSPEKTANIPYYHVDVFSSEPLAGNGLIVFTCTDGISKDTMQLLTKEMRQYESIFLQRLGNNRFRAWVFTCQEELNFAGHPVLGAAATLHNLETTRDSPMEWWFELNEKTVKVSTTKNNNGYDTIMNQGKAEFGKVLNEEETATILNFLNATPEDLHPGLCPTVVSTGLPYLIVPFRDNQFRARVGAPGLEEHLHRVGAKFIGLLDIKTLSIRSGDNDGLVEDAATGSLAGPAGAFLVHHGLERLDTVISISQGKNLSRNSKLYVELKSCPDTTADVFVGGSVCTIARGELDPGLMHYPLQYTLHLHRQ